MLNRILYDEEQADSTEASMNVHLQYYSKNVGNIKNNFKRVVEKIDHCEDDIGLLQQGQADQETFNQAVLERMWEMKTKMEEWTERIILLEEEVATLRWRKACMCRERKGKETTIASGSRDQEEQSELEYAKEEGPSSYQGHSHSKLSVAQGAGSKLSADKILPTTHR